MYILDASVAAAAAHPRELHHKAARIVADSLRLGSCSFVVPSLFFVEVSASLVRRGATSAGACAFAKSFVLAATKVEGLGTQRSVLVGAFAAETGLRAADAVYAWLAKKYGATLLTLDDEVIRKSRDFYMAKHP